MTKKIKLPEFLTRDLVPPSKTDIALLLSQLSMLLEAGFSVSETLIIAAKKTRRTEFRRILLQLSDKMMQGMSLSDAMEDFPSFFPPRVSGFVRIGERSGRLKESLGFLSDEILRDNSISDRLRSAFAYPVTVLILCILAVYFAIPMIIGMFEPIYAGSGSELPAITVFVRSASKAFSASAPYTFALILAAAVIFFIAYKKSKNFAVFIDTVKLRLPLLGSILQNDATAKFARALSWLDATSCPAKEKFRIIASSYSNKRCAKDIASIPDKLFRGSSFRDIISASVIFSPVFRDIASMFIGNADTENALIRSAVMLEKENETLILRLMSRLSVLSTLVVAVLVGIVAIALFLPTISMDIGL